MRKPVLLSVILLFTALCSFSQSQKKKTTALQPADLEKEMLSAYLGHMKIKDDSSSRRIIVPGTDTFHYTPRFLYIRGTELFPAVKEDSIGFTLQPKSGQAQPLMLENGTTAYFNHCLGMSIHKTDSLYPVVVKIKKLAITETRRDVLYDDCKIFFEYVFECRYNNKNIPLTSYAGEASMRVVLGTRKAYDSLIRQSINTVVPRIDELMEEAMDKIPDLCKAVNHTIDFRSNGPGSDTLFYNGQSPFLSWSDYTGITSNEDQFISYGGIFFQPEVNYKEGRLNIATQIGTCFIKSLSLAGDNVRKAEVLRHENYRLKLIHYYTLKLKSELEKMQLTMDNYKDELNTAFLSINAEMKAAQEAYNSETRFGLKKKDQQKWEESIHDRLTEFSQ